MLAFTVMKNWEKAVAIMAHKGSPRHPLLIEALMVSKLYRYTEQKEIVKRNKYCFLVFKIVCLNFDGNYLEYVIT